MGDSTEAIVFIHGLGASMRYWGRAYDSLDEGHSLVFVDLLGFGGSLKPDDASHSLEAHAGAIAGSVVELGLNAKLVVGQTNPLLQFDDENEFVNWFLTTFPAAPDYFYKLRPITQAGPRLRSDITDPPALSAPEFRDQLVSGIIIDTRHIDEFMKGHIRGAISIAFRPSYSTWLGWVVPLSSPLYFVIGNGPLEDVLNESLLVGHENFAGWLEGGMESWKRAGLPVQTARSVATDDVRQLLKEGAFALDVRELGEFEAGHIDGAINMPLGDLSALSDSLPKTAPIIAYCGHGERAMTGISILE